jgi:Fe-S cluster biogenesis protein NfuA
MDFSDKERLNIRVNEALDEIRPHLAVDGGDIELVDITDDFIVQVKWLGNCEFCTMSVMTMRAGVEQAIMNRISEIKGVHAVNGMLAR